MASGSFRKRPTEGFLIRPATLADTPAMALIASTTYMDTMLDTLLSPYRFQYRADHNRGYQQRITMRMVDPRNLSVVACPVSNPSTPIAYAQFVRLGTDEAAKAHARRRASVWLTLQRWYYTVKFRIVNWIWPDRSADREASKVFEASCDGDDARYWKAFPERDNRWQAQSVVVREEWQGCGVGSRMMSEVLVRAREDDVIVGLTASGPGEQMYTKLGFRLLGQFTSPVEPEGQGGYMMWTPEKKTALTKEDEAEITNESLR